MRGRIAVLAALTPVLLAGAGCAADAAEGDAAARQDKARLTTRELSVFTTSGRADRYVGEVLSAAFRKAGYASIVRRFERTDQIDAASAHVYLSDDPGLQERWPQIAERHPGAELVNTHARTRDVVVVRADQAKALKDPATFRELAERNGPLPVGVRQAALTAVQNALAAHETYQELRVIGEDVTDPAGFLKGTPRAAVIVPEHDPLLTGADKEAYRVLEDQDGVLPERALMIIAGAAVDDQARALAGQVAEKLDRGAVDEAVKGKVEDFPARAEKWAAEAGLTPVVPVPPSPSPEPEPDDGFPLPLALLIGVLLLAAAVAVLRFRAVHEQRRRWAEERYWREERDWTVRHRQGARRSPEDEFGPAAAERTGHVEHMERTEHPEHPEHPGRTERTEHPGRTEQWPAVTRPVRDLTERVELPPRAPDPAPVPPADPGGPLLLGRAPAPRAVHLPYLTGSEQPGVALDGGMLKGTTIRAASVRGRAHSYRGESRQDAYGVRLTPDEQWVIVAVADGVGSARHADVASNAAVQAALDRVSDETVRSPDPREWDWAGMIAHVAQAIEEATKGLGPATPGTNARGRGPGARPATTLTVGVVPAMGEGPGVCAAVGDSPALLLSGGRWYELVGTGGGGAHVALTAALPGDTGALEVRPFEWRRGDLLLLSSDGFAVSLERGRGGFARRLAVDWQVPPDLREFYRQVDFRASTHEDDRTAVAVWAGNHDTAVR